MDIAYYALYGPDDDDIWLPDDRKAPAAKQLLGAFEIETLSILPQGSRRERLSTFLQRHLTWVFVLTCGIIAVPTVTAHYRLQGLLAQEVEAAHIVNLAGRQRMLSQRIAFLSNRMTENEGTADQQVREQLLNATELFEKTHLGLMLGSAEFNLPGTSSSPGLRKIYFDQTHRLDQRVERYVRAARIVADPPAPGGLEQKYAVREINRTAEKLLISLEQAVTQFESEAAASIGDIETTETRLWYLQLTIIFLLFIGVLMPLGRIVRRRTSLLNASEVRFLAAAHMARLGYFEWRDDVAASVTYSDEFRRVVDEAIGKSPDHADFRKWVVAAMYALDRDRYTESLERHIKLGRPYSIEFRLVGMDGNVHHFTEHGTALERLKTGGFRWLGTLQDVTALHDTQEKLAQQESLMRLIMENLPGAIIYTDADMDIVFASPKFAEVYGVPSHFLEAGAHYPNYLMYLAQNGFYGPGKTADLVKARVESLRNPPDEPLEDRTPDGRTFSVRRQQVAGGGVVTVINEITDLHNARIAALEAARAKSEFLASMSHEIRTPMTGILGFADMLLDSNLRSVDREMIEKIKLATMSLLTIINDILDLSKIEAGKLQIETIDFELRPLVAGVIELVEDKARGKGLSLRHTIGDRVPAGINADPTRLRQVLINLLGNAVKFTHEGHVALGVDIGPAPSGRGEAVRFRIEDTGIGITPDTVSKLFEDFTQADASISRKYEGSGLGLSISKKLVGIMGGDISVESTVDVGSTFEFWIPYTPCKTDVLATPVEKPVAGYRTSRPIHVLVAEDNTLNQRIIAAILEKYGHTHTVVGSGTAAVAALEHERFDLILMDVRMPEMSGTEATRMIRQMNGDMKDVPIIALTADAMPDHVDRYMDAGMTAFVAKPIDQMRLLETINKVMGETIHAEVCDLRTDEGHTDGDTAGASAVPAPDPKRAEEISNFLDSIKKNDRGGKPKPS